MATYRIVDMYRKSKAVKGIHYDSWDEPIYAYRVDKRHSLLFGLIHYWDYGEKDLSLYFFCSINKAKDTILKVDKSRRVTILYKQLMKIENIKFKAKSILDEAWVQGDLIHKEDGKIAILRNGFNVSEVNPSTVCMFTGLKDCEGNEIWEGDIISSPHFERVATVKWDDSLCGFKCSDVTGNINFCFTAIAHCSEWSIVGNKFDKKIAYENTSHIE